MNECILVVINLIVSGEHRVHFNTDVCSRFCCTPRPFQAYGYPLLLLYLGGSVFILVFRQECVPMQRCTLRLLVLWHNSIGSLFLSTYTTLDILFSDFSLSPVFTAEDFGIMALLRDWLLARCLLRLLIIIRPDTPKYYYNNKLLENIDELISSKSLKGTILGSIKEEMILNGISCLNDHFR